MSDLIEPVRVLIADDDPSVLHALQEAIQVDESLEVVGMASDTIEAVALAASCMPHVAVLDWKMPGGGGSEAARAIRASQPDVRLIAFSAERTKEAVLDMLRAGASSYLTKGSSVAHILSTIHRAMMGQATLSSDVTKDVVDELLRASGDDDERLRRARQADRIREIIEQNLVTVVFQGIYDLERRALVGVEALSRFRIEPRRPPNVWFAEAGAVGCGKELELWCAERALAQLGELAPPLYLSINASPDVVVSPELGELLSGVDRARVVVEVTEHSAVEDYETLKASIERLRSAGVRLAIDDAGGGFASLQHVLRLEPDIVKLDFVLCRGIHADPARLALGRGLASFGKEMGAAMLAEGIEVEEELDALVGARIQFGQGFLMDTPGPLPRPLSF